MMGWVISVVTLSILLSIIKNFIPNKKFDKTIGVVLSLILLLVAIKPIYNVFSKEINKPTIDLNVNVDNSIDGVYVKLYEKQILYLANKRDIQVANLQITTNNDSYIIKKVIINIKNTELFKTKENISILRSFVDDIYSTISVENNAIEIFCDDEKII